MSAVGHDDLHQRRSTPTTSTAPTLCDSHCGRGWCNHRCPWHLDAYWWHFHIHGGGLSRAGGWGILPGGWDRCSLLSHAFPRGHRGDVSHGGPCTDARRHHTAGARR